MRFENKVVIITGAAQGIGRACARRFAREGAFVVIADLDEASGRELEDEIKSAGGTALYVHVDAAERLDIHNMLAATLDTYERVDVLVNNVGIDVVGDFLEFEEADFDRVLRVNLKSAFLCSQAVARRMVEQIELEGGARHDEAGYAIINMSSVSALTANGDNVAYAASKAGLNQLTRAMAIALAPHSIRVNAIAPGKIATDAVKKATVDLEARDAILTRTPLGRVGTPGEIASIAAFLASEDAAYMTGQCLYAEGGRLALNYTMNKSTKD